jgi:hypothetical protein
MVSIGGLDDIHLAMSKPFNQMQMIVLLHWPMWNCLEFGTYDAFDKFKKMSVEGKNFYIEVAKILLVYSLPCQRTCSTTVYSSQLPTSLIWLLTSSQEMDGQSKV